MFRAAMHRATPGASPRQGANARGRVGPSISRRKWKVGVYQQRSTRIAFLSPCANFRYIRRTSPSNGIV
ncbi:hypothetical protein Rvan_0544 [Rhodomicrobium vannielii ATCC 17100]|uniref:Uncharacterized protein n=1 Tax=Rhodomicrobium vannielii (strain ATCC 17100 / DSM 162 / LMG 4299 / NCIMB 10020 / ATH 3.1.1) TaxID=648757 RepID=E3HYT4_RHOVT|nr:hypothetical protein Rvan_0544 [Rhodomicrobium vannielii ATCC 17100]